MEGQLERERRGLWMRRGRGQTSPGAALDGAKARDSQQGEVCSYRGSPPIKQVAASQIRLIFLITEDLASSQEQGGHF